MEIKLEDAEVVMEKTKCTHKEAKEALENSNGNVLDAIIYIEEGKVNKKSEKNDELKEKIKNAIKKGNVDKIQIKRNDEIILSIPVNVGMAAGILGVAAAPWAVIAGAIAAYGFDCKFEIIKDDGSSEEL